MVVFKLHCAAARP